MRNNITKLFVLGGSLASLPVFAAPTDYSALTAAADFSTAATAIVAIFATVAVAVVAWKGGKMVLTSLRG